MLKWRHLLAPIDNGLPDVFPAGGKAGLWKLRIFKQALQPGTLFCTFTIVIMTDRAVGCKQIVTGYGRFGILQFGKNPVAGSTREAEIALQPDLVFLTHQLKFGFTLFAFEPKFHDDFIVFLIHFSDNNIAFELLAAKHPGSPLSKLIDLVEIGHPGTGNLTF